MSFADKVQGEKVLVFGLGLQGGGLGDALWLFNHRAKVRVTDQKNESQLAKSLLSLPMGIEKTLGKHLDEDVRWADLVLKNPGVPDNQPQIVLARQLGKPVLSSIGIVVNEARKKTIAVTGTRGKSTTTELIYQILYLKYPGRVAKGGNIPGTSGLSLLDKLSDLTYLVLELSSFQLHSFHEQHVSPHIAVITNMYPDHFNRYQNMDAYLFDKTAISTYQDKHDFTLYNFDNEYAQRIALKSAGQKIGYSRIDIPQSLGIILPGDHNRENIAAVLALAKLLKIETKYVQKIVSNFPGLPYRIEKRRTLRGINFINDTTSTTPTSTIKALNAMQAPTILIIGGDDKKLPYDDLLSALSNSSILKGIVILGGENIPDFVSCLSHKLNNKIFGQVFSMQEAVELAFTHAASGDNILLSPGFSSFDLFKNEFDRGEEFNRCVSDLI